MKTFAKYNELNNKQFQKIKKQAGFSKGKEADDYLKKLFLLNGTKLKITFCDYFRYYLTS